MFVAGVGGGVGLALLLGMLRPAVYTREGFQAFTDLPVLGTVSRLWTPREQLRRRAEVASYALGCALLAGMFAGLMVIYSTQPELLARIQELDVAAQLQSLQERFL